MTDLAQTTHGSGAGLAFPIVDGLGMPTLERKWLEQWHAGGARCLNTCVAVWENASEAIALISGWRRFVSENADIAAIATSVREIEEVIASGRLALVLGFQNTSPVEHNIELFGAFRDLGICIMQLTYNLQNYIGAGYWEEKDVGISSRFGRNALAEMNRLGILIDLSHCGERTTLDAIELSEKPVAITHSNPRDYVVSPVYPAGRLKTSEALQALARRGGVIGLTPNRNMTKNGAATTLPEFCDMVSWTVDRIGIDSVAIGTDYCPGHSRTVRTWWRYARWSRESAPAKEMVIAPHEGWSEWIQSPADLPNIVRGLENRGLNREEIEKIMGGNWLRLFSQTIERPV